MAGKFAENPNYVRQEDLLQKLHAIIAAGGLDSQEADHIRDEIDETFDELAPDERARIEGLSADLYMLADAEVYAKRPPELSSDDALRREAERTYRANDWANLLRLMRFGMPWFNLGQAAFLRGRQYERLGHLRTAFLFYEKAVRSDAANSNYKIVLLHTMEHLGNISDAVAFAKDLFTNDQSDPKVITAAAGVLQSHAANSDLKEANRDLIPKLKSAIQQMRSEEDGETPPTVLVCAIAVLAYCYRNIGDLPKAIEVWSTAVSIQDEPNKWLDHVALGQLRLEARDIEGAAKDFERAVQLNALVGIPYLYLAHRYFDKSEYSRVLTLLDKALTLQTSPSFQARCWELKAITQHVLGLSPKQVRRSFEQAIGLDPFNERIQHNFMAFQASTAGNATPFTPPPTNDGPDFDPVAHSRYAAATSTGMGMSMAEQAA